MMGSLQAASPLLALAAAVAGLMGVIALRRGHALATSVCGIGLAAALVCVPWALAAPGNIGGRLFVFDPLSLGLTAVILLSSGAVLVLSYGYWAATQAVPREEYPLLLLLATLGAVALTASDNFLTLFLGLETMTLAMIGLIAYPRFRPEAEEAGLKYLVLSGVSSAFVLFGIGLIELSTGSLALVVDPGHLGHGTLDRQMAMAAIAMIGVGVGFKLSVVPFHIWVPDIYAGAPAPSGAYVAVISKIAVLAVIMRVLASPLVALSSGAVGAITLIAILSMVIGNLLALMQENLKRILGYSSIAHFGYLLVALLAADAIGRIALVFYLVMYAITVIAAFGVVGLLSAGDQPRDLDQVDDLRGLFWTRPAIATIMTLALLSLAGIPPAIGFIAKMYILASAVHTALWLLTSVMVIGSVIGLFYYLRIIIVMSQKPEEAVAPRRALPLPGGVAIVCLTIPLVLFGVEPQPLISLLKSVLG